MTDILHLDTETYSEVDLKRHGTHRYADEVEVMLLGYALNDDAPRMWDLTTDEPMPKDLANALWDPAVMIVAQNSHFDRTVIRKGLRIPIPASRFFDTMVQAMCHSLPGSLEKIGAVLKLDEDEAKSKRGRQLIQLFCKPRPKNNKLRRATRETHPEEWQEFIDYCLQDVVAMRHARKKMPMWNMRPGSTEHKLWILDQKINDRGFAVDLDLANAAIVATDRAKAALKARVHAETAGVVDSATKRDLLLGYILAEHGVNLPDLTSDTIKRRMEDPELPESLKLLLGIRLEASMASSAKYKALVNSASADGRLRNTLQFAAALRTQRWGGRIFQPHNMKRPDPDMADESTLNLMIEAIKDGALDLVHDEPMRVMANVVRGCIIAPPRKKLVVADLANIEGRKLAWLADENWKLKAFADFDAGKGEDMYKLSYARAFNTTPDRVDSYMRQIGKVMELALGYEGGVGAFLTFAIVYKMDLDELAEAVWLSADIAAINQAGRMWDWTVKKHRTTYGLDRHVWIACELLKAKWREAHPEVTKLWKRLAGAVLNAITTPGVAFTAGLHLKAQRDGSWLRIRLPSGRCLCYLHPQVNAKGEISYMGVNQYTRQWARIKTYGGKLVENVTQASSRDVLAYNMPGIEDEIELLDGDPNSGLILTVHDEVLAEVADDCGFTHERMSEIMSTVPPWAEGLPLSAKGFETTRYRKD